MIPALIIVTLLLSAFFSGSEIAYVAANKLRVEVIARRGGFVGATVIRFLKDPSTLLTTTLVGNNLALVAYSTLFALYLSPSLNAFFAGNTDLAEASVRIAVMITQTAIASTIVLIVGEVIPKSVLREIANRAVFKLAVPLRITYFILLPMIIVARWSAVFIVKLVSADADVISKFMRRDFELLIEESKIRGELDLDDDESTLLSNVFAMGSIRVKESMVPRTEIVAVDETTSVDQILEVFVASGHSKIPVYRDNIDHIVGVAFAYDLFHEPDSLAEMMRPAAFIPEAKLSKSVLQDFLETKTSIAIVIDEYGGTAGIVTTEDLLEELFGDIQDEFDNEDNGLRSIDENTVIASGRIGIDELAEETGLVLPDGDYETIAGYLLERLGTIPSQRDEIEIDGFRFVILQAVANRVDLVRVMKLDRPVKET